MLRMRTRLSRTGARKDRLKKLADMLAGQSHLRLRTVAIELGVSEMTVRRDLMEADSRFACLGGYIIEAHDDTEPADYTLHGEMDHHAAAKMEACARAAMLIEEDDAIFIDCGTTTPHLAATIPPGMRLTAVCYSLNVAEILSQRQNTRLILLGGLFHPGAASFSGECALEELKRVNLNKAFISAGGVHEARGVTCSHFHEVPVKRMAIARAIEAHLVIDASKFGKVRAAHFAEIPDFVSIISDQA